MGSSREDGAAHEGANRNKDRSTGGDGPERGEAGTVAAENGPGGAATAGSGPRGAATAGSGCRGAAVAGSGPGGVAGSGTGGAAAAGRIDPELMRLAAILLVGAIAALLDTTIVNVAIRTIGRDLHAPLGVVQWVMTGYLLSYGMVIPLSGWALARFGGRATWLTALSVFLAASMAAGAVLPAAMLPGRRTSRAAGPGAPGG